MINARRLPKKRAKRGFDPQCQTQAQEGAQSNAPWRGQKWKGHGQGGLAGRAVGASPLLRMCQPSSWCLGAAPAPAGLSLLLELMFSPGACCCNRGIGADGSG